MPLNEQEKAAARDNRAKSQDEVITILRDSCPHVVQFTRRVGAWLWIEFPQKPDGETRYKVALAGFTWNNDRKAWQNPCGHWTTRARGYDPRTKYGEIPVENEAPMRRAVA